MIFRWLYRRKVQRSVFGKYITMEVIEKVLIEPLSEWGCFVGLFWRLPKGREGVPAPPAPTSN